MTTCESGAVVWSGWYPCVARWAMETFAQGGARVAGRRAAARAAARSEREARLDALEREIAERRRLAALP